MMRAIIVLFAAQTLWPWQQYHHRHYRHSPGQTITEPAPNCDEINAVVKSLPPDRYERALRSATKEQQRIIIDCEAKP
jgi:hypothetical protein